MRWSRNESGRGAKLACVFWLIILLTFWSCYQQSLGPWCFLLLWWSSDQVLPGNGVGVEFPSTAQKGPSKPSDKERKVLIPVSQRFTALSRSLDKLISSYLPRFLEGSTTPLHIRARSCTHTQMISCQPLVTPPGRKTLVSEKQTQVSPNSKTQTFLTAL